MHPPPPPPLPPLSPTGPPALDSALAGAGTAFVATGTYSSSDPQIQLSEWSQPPSSSSGVNLGRC